jgi:hypothetical protein
MAAVHLLAAFGPRWPYSVITAAGLIFCELETSRDHSMTNLTTFSSMDAWEACATGVIINVENKRSG